MTRQAKSKVWSPAMLELIARFQRAPVPAEPFALRPGSFVADPTLFRSAILDEIATGPAGPRAFLGGLEADLRDFFGRENGFLGRSGGPEKVKERNSS